MLKTLALHYQLALSKKKHKMMYLNPGMGDPCAGQSREIDVLASNSKEDVLSSVENFGLALPMGSI